MEEETEAIDPTLKEEIIHMTISGETEKLKEKLTENKQLCGIKDWVRERERDRDRDRDREKEREVEDRVEGIL